MIPFEPGLAIFTMHTEYALKREMLRSLAQRPFSLSSDMLYIIL